MNCASCGDPNRAGARFCGGCGKPLTPHCPACGRENELGRRFCDGCGTPLAVGTVEAAGARKVVTVVFADLVGSTALHERLDAESVRRFMDRYYEAMRGAVEAEGGTVTQLLGDGVMAVFGAPRVAEDDAIRAVRAAVGMQHAFRTLAAAQSAAVGQTGLRVAVNTGEVVASDQSEIIGDPVNVAARLQEQARDGDVVIGESTRRLVSELVTLAPLGTFALKGRAETVAAYRVVSLDRPAGVAASAFVGRDDELRRLTAVYEAAVAAPGARLAVILGSPGLGKSRLLAELARRLGSGATIVTARCDATGGATFAPLAEALRTLLDLGDGSGREAVRAAIDRMGPGDDAERDRIAAGVAALLAGTPAPPEETFFVVRRLLTALAAAQPVVLAIDDLQWAESLLLDLTEHLVQWSTDVPLLVLVAARPELREVRSALAVPGGLVADVVTLAGLDAGAATRLAANVIGADELPAAIAGRVLATSEGNPLFVGELVRMLVHDGALKREGDRWTTAVELAALEMPPTIHALLAARLERLGPEERTVLEHAAVIGRQFSRAAVAQLLPGGVRDLDARLESLRRSELIEPDTGWLLGEPVLRFHHVLIRDAAYRRLLKGTRAELHGRFADWLESRVGEAVEHDETIGWHLEQAHRHLRELGPLDDSGRVLGVRAARYLAAAGRRALARDDLPLAASLLGRALEGLDTADPTRAELALDWCEALLAAGDVGPAADAIAELGRFIEGSERLRAWHTCFIGQRAALTDPQALHVTVDAVAAAADALAAAGDAAGEAKAHFVHAIALSRLGKVGACEAALDRALAAARRGHDRRRANAVLAGAPLAALWGPSPVTRASGRCLDVVRVLRITQGAPAVEAVALRCQAVLEALRGRTEAARRMIASSRNLVEELGITQRLLEADVFAGLIELLEGDAVAAEVSLRPAYDGLRQHGLGIDAAQAAALLGRALLAQGRAAEAEAVSHESEALAGDDLKAAIAWRGVRAEALARRGEHVAAVELARAAVDIAAATDALLDHADARLALAAAFRAAGRSDDGDTEEGRAIELWEAKGATLLAERARRDGRQTIQVDRTSEDRPEPTHYVRRRVPPNAATAIAARLDAAVAARDADALYALFADHSETVHHPTGVIYDRGGALARAGDLLKADGLTMAHEPLATLGDSLALCRVSVAASGISSGRFDVGAYESEQIALIEADAHGQRRRAEFFADDRLGDAVARLYERYADLLPDGPARTRAAATAHSIAGLYGPSDRWRARSAPFAPDAEARDHRTVGFGSLRGADAVLGAVGALYELAEDFDDRFDDVLDLRSDALVVRATTSGTLRATGGAFAQDLCQFFVFGAEGLVTRWEQFDAEQDTEALARFDELTAEPSAARIATAPAAEKRGRRVRPNAATAHLVRTTAAMARRDIDDLAATYSEHYEWIDHTSGRSLDREQMLSTLRKVLRVDGVSYDHEQLATLGDALVLDRFTVSASGMVAGEYDVGPYRQDGFGIHEVVASGECRRSEIFAADRLSAAVTRLYERYAELVPDGSARTRAAATARSIAVLLGPVDPDRYAGAFAPAIEAVDHRALISFGSALGAEALLQGLRIRLSLVDNAVARVDDLLGLQSDALLMRWTVSGTDRASGGAYEILYLQLMTFGTDGLTTRVERFDRDDEALARFDELTAEPAAARYAAVPSRAVEKRERRVRPNAATTNAARTNAAFAARDADAFPSLLAERSEVVEHPTGATYDRQGALRAWRAMLKADDLTFRYEPLATLGDSLALCGHSLSASGVASGAFDVGAYESERVLLSEVDAQGRRRWAEIFAPERLGDAVVRLYERYADLLPDGPARARAAATARSVAGLVAPTDVDAVDRYAAALASNVDFVDHQSLGFGSVRGPEMLVRGFRMLFEMADDIVWDVDGILVLQSDAILVHRKNSGTARAGGGPFERQFIYLVVFGADGLATRVEMFDADRDDEALARFDELTGESAAARTAAASARAAEKHQRRVRANAATANTARLDAAIAARDADALPNLVADEYEAVDHTTGATFDQRGSLATWRSLLRAKDPTCRQEPLATLGDSLVLSRVLTSASGFVGGKFDVGAYEREEIVLNEADAHGRRRRGEIFATDRLGDAVVRLYERYAELLPDGPARARAAATARSVAVVLVGPVDPDRFATAQAPAVEAVDHRILGMGSARGAGTLLRVNRSLFELADDITLRIDDVLALRPDALLVRQTTTGTVRASGGAFEQVHLLLRVFGDDGLQTRIEQFDADRTDEALARFDELTAEPAAVRTAAARARAAEKRARRVRANASTAHAARVDAAIAARDINAFPALLADGMENVHRPTGTVFGREGVLSTFRFLLKAQDPTLLHEPLATLGDSLGLYRMFWSAGGGTGLMPDIGASEADQFILIEVDPHGRRRRSEVFAGNRLGDGVACLYEQYADLLPDGPARARAAATARSVAVALGPADPDRYATAQAPAVDIVDHRILGMGSVRGAGAILRVNRTLFELADEISVRVDDVLALRPAALLVRQTTAGTVRASGGAFEQVRLQLRVFGDEGVQTRIELFDADRDDEALARFDELTAEPAAARVAAAPSRAAEKRERRVRPNAATANAARIDTAIVARDADAVTTLLADEYKTVDHTTGVTFDRQGALSSMRFLLSAHDPTYLHEPLATLGDSLALFRVLTSASGFVGGTFDVGAYEKQQITLTEVDSTGRQRHGEQFATDRLGDAVACLYERYADLLPNGPARARAAATARSVAVVLVGPFDPDRYATAQAPDVEAVDHRILGMGSAQGAGTLLRVNRSLFELADDITLRIDDVLALRPDALLVRQTTTGTDRASGGAFEQVRLQLQVFGDDGLQTRIELFDADRAPEALARFDELTAEPAASRIAAAPSRAPEKHERRVRPNAATANAARIDTAIARRDADALPILLAEEVEVVHHPTGVVYDRRGLLDTWRSLLRARDPTSRHEPLATLGDTLALFCTSTSASSFVGGRFDVGAYEIERFYLLQVDANGRQRQAEVFAADRLGVAVARLYERYADLLPDGPARARAAATAGSVAAYLRPSGLDHFAVALAPAIETVDHRILGTWSARGVEAVLKHNRALLEVADAITVRVDEVLGLQSDAFLLRRTHSGTGRASGGAYETQFLALSIFGTDGRIARNEFFDVDRAGEALARFDELTGEPVAARIPAAPSRAAVKRERRVRPNAATANAAGVDAAIVARDADAFTTLLADECETVDHTTGATFDRRGALATWRSLLRAQDPACRQEPLATLGDSLALLRVLTSASGFVGGKFDVGAYEREEIALIEVDAHGRCRRREDFAADRMGAAVARLYERYADLLPDGPARARAAATARSVAAMLGASFDPNRYATVFAPAIESVDHRTLGTFSAHGADALLLGLRSWSDLVADIVMGSDEILSLRPDALLLRWNFFGIDRAGGGALERPFIWLLVFGNDGLLARYEQFDTERDAEALARFDELDLNIADEPPTAPATTVRIENAATRAGDRIRDAWDAGDWERHAALFPAGVRISDRGKMVRLELDRDQALESFRSLFEMTSSPLRSELLATRGNRLAMSRVHWQGTGEDVGPSEIELISIVEVDEHGDPVAIVQFDPEDLDAAYAELDDRYVAGEAAAFATSVRWGSAFRRVVAARGEMEAAAALLAADFVVHDHSPLGWGILDRPAYVESVKALFALAPDSRRRTDHLWLSDGGALGVHVLLGTHEGGAFEQPRVTVSEIDAQGRERRRDIYTLDQLDEAKARFAALGASADRDPIAALARPNAATAAMDRVQVASAARDWAAVRGACREDATFEDRRRQTLLSGDREWWVAYLQSIAEVAADAAFERRLVATFGDRVDLERHTWRGGPTDGPFEVELLYVTEVDEAGTITAGIAFEVDDWQAAESEARTRWLARDARAASVVGPDAEFIDAWNAHDVTRVRAALADDFVVDDHRRTGIGVIESADAYVDSIVALWDLAPDQQLGPPVRLALERYGLVQAVRAFGTLRDGGGAFERLLLSVAIVSSGRIGRYEFFEIDDVDAALARFAELRPDPLRIPPNAATGAIRRLGDALDARDWDVVGALCAPALVHDDRRRHLLLTSDRDMFITSLWFVAPQGSRRTRTLLATAGERLALEHVLWTGTVDAPEMEIELLAVVEVDAEGRLVALIHFDPDDRRAASAEMLERYARGDAARWTPAAWFELRRATIDHDLERYRAATPRDFVFHDHRRIGPGRVEAADFIAWMAALFERSPDAIIEPLYLIAEEKHGTLAIAHTFGTLTDGGEFESVFVQLALFQSGQLVGAEVFEPEHLDVARARFEELRPDPLRIPPNAASRARDRTGAAFATCDWQALRALVSDDFVFDDRRKIMALTGDVELWIKSQEVVSSSTSGVRVRRDLIGTVGERIAIERVLWTGRGPEGGEFEAEGIMLSELDADGRLRASINFDLDDRRAAFAEAQARFVAGEAAAVGGQTPIAALFRAYRQYDWVGQRASLADDLTFRDHRTLGLLGTLGGDEWVESLRIQADLAPDVAVERPQILAWNCHGRVDVTRVFGTMREGGPFENVFVDVIVTGGDRIRHFEIFDVGAADQALARFAELCAERRSPAA